MKVYYYSISTFSQWSSIDNGYVLANNEEEAKQFAIDHIQQQYDKVNELLNGFANFDFDKDHIEVTLSNFLPDIK